MSGAADTRFPLPGQADGPERGGEVAGLIAEIVQRDAQARRERERRDMRRRLPVLLCLLVLLTGFGTWNFLRITKRPTLPPVQVEQAARAQLFLIASSLDAYRAEHGELPGSLDDAALDAAGVEYRVEGGRYELVARLGAWQLTFREGQDRRPFAAALGVGGGR